MNYYKNLKIGNLGKKKLNLRNIENLEKIKKERDELLKTQGESLFQKASVTCFSLNTQPSIFSNTLHFGLKAAGVVVSLAFLSNAEYFTPRHSNSAYNMLGYFGQYFAVLIGGTSGYFYLRNPKISIGGTLSGNKKFILPSLLLLCPFLTLTLAEDMNMLSAVPLMIGVGGYVTLILNYMQHGAVPKWYAKLMIRSSWLVAMILLLNIYQLAGRYNYRKQMDQAYLKLQKEAKSQVKRE